MVWRVVHFIGGVVGTVQHLSVSVTVRISAKVHVLVSVDMSDMMEWGAEENVGILTQ